MPEKINPFAYAIRVQLLSETDITHVEYLLCKLYIRTGQLLF